MLKTNSDHKGCKNSRQLETTSSGLTLLWFSARWCGPCQQMAPTYKAINELYSDVIDIEKIDVDDNPELAVNHQIRGVPSLVIINNDGEIARQVGAQPQQVLERWIDETVQTQYVT